MVQRYEFSMRNENREMRNLLKKYQKSRNPDVGLRQPYVVIISFAG